MRVAAASMEKTSRARIAAAAPTRRRMSGSSAIPRRRCASASTSPGGKRNPLRPSSIISGTPPTADATAQQPQAIASSSAFGNPSDRDVSTKTSIICIQRGMSLVVCSKWQALASPSSSRRLIHALRIGPSPTMRSRSPGWSGSTRAKASMRISRRFSSRRTHTFPMTSDASWKNCGRGDGAGKNTFVSTPL